MLFRSCPGCKEALFDPQQAQQSIRLAQGYALSIGLMLLTPAALIGGVAALILRSVRRSKRMARGVAHRVEMGSGH